VAMTQEHKDALAQGRAEARAIKAYLKALAARKPGRPVTRESLNKRLATVRKKLGVTDDVLRRVELIQSRLEIERALAEVDRAVDFANLEAGFVKHARSYSLRKGISYTAWREIGVPASALKSADIPETRRR
jgi:hypothetical protein